MTEEKDFYTIDEVADAIGVKRASVYHYITVLNIKTQKFKLSRNAYISKADMERIKEAKEKPWLSGPADETDTTKDEPFRPAA